MDTVWLQLLVVVLILGYRYFQVPLGIESYLYAASIGPSNQDICSTETALIHNSMVLPNLEAWKPWVRKWARAPSAQVLTSNDWLSVVRLCSTNFYDAIWRHNSYVITAIVSDLEIDYNGTTIQVLGCIRHPKQSRFIGLYSEYKVALSGDGTKLRYEIRDPKDHSLLAYTYNIVNPRSLIFYNSRGTVVAVLEDDNEVRGYANSNLTMLPFLMLKAKMAYTRNQDQSELITMAC